MTEFGKAIAEEMEEFHVNLWLAPRGMKYPQKSISVAVNAILFRRSTSCCQMLAAAVIRGCLYKSGCGVNNQAFCRQQSGRQPHEVLTPVS
ncbi:MAG: hypothetical protein ACLU3F_11065 [Blautia wexlerae]